MALAVGGFVVVLALCAAAFLVLDRGGTAHALDVTLQPVGGRGSGPFTASVVTATPAALRSFADKAGSAHKAGATTTTTKKAATSSKPKSGLSTHSVDGDTDGLYGVDADTAVADGDALAGHLADHRPAAAAWASAMGVPSAAIASTIHKLTPVVLTHDTAVTQHNFAAGHAGSYQAILQTGSVVFIDAHGAPVVDAVSGDPLSPPHLAADGGITFHGEQWSGFDRHDIASIDAAHSELDTIDGVDIHTGAATTIGLGGTVSLSGYLVSNDSGVSVVSKDGKKTTTIVDHPVGRVFADGMGGIVYEDSISNDPSTSGDEPHSIMWLRAGAATPTKLVDVTSSPGMDLILLATGNFAGDPVAFYARQIPSSGSGAGSSLVVHDLESGQDHTVTALAGGNVSSTFLDFLGNLAYDGAVGEHHLIIEEAQGTAPELFEVNEQYQLSEIKAPFCDSSIVDFNTCDVAIVPRFQSNQVELVESYWVDQPTVYLTKVDLSASSVVSRTKLNDPSDFECNNHAGDLHFKGSEAVASFAPTENGAPGCNSKVIDLETQTATALPFTGTTLPLASPIIRPAGAGNHTPASTTTTASATTTATPSTTLAPTTTLPPVPTMNLQQIAAGDYSSLLGTWTEVAIAGQNLGGTGRQWYPAGAETDVDTLSISSGEITLSNGFTMQGNSLTDSDGTDPVTFQRKGSYLQATCSGPNSAFGWEIDFYPKGAVDLDSELTPNNGITLNSQVDTIYIWTSNNGYSNVFTRAG